MRGFLLTFFTQQDRMHRGVPIGEWLLREAQRLGFGGATLTTAAEGFGHHRRIHSARFFELADQPVEVSLALSAEECTRFFARLEEEKLKIFYVKTPVEFGTTGEG